MARQISVPIPAPRRFRVPRKWLEPAAIALLLIVVMAIFMPRFLADAPSSSPAPISEPVMQPAPGFVPVAAATPMPILESDFRAVLGTILNRGAYVLKGKDLGFPEYGFPLTIWKSVKGGPIELVGTIPAPLDTEIKDGDILIRVVFSEKKVGFFTSINEGSTWVGGFYPPVFPPEK